MDDFTLKFVSKIVEWTDAKIKYRHRGTTKAGCDCSGLLIGVLQSLGYMKNYKLREYPIDWNLHAKADNYLEDELLKIADKVSGCKMGSIVLFHFGKCKAHLGIVVNKEMIFAHQVRDARRTSYSTLRNSPWGKRVAGVYRLNEDKIKKFG